MLGYYTLANLMCQEALHFSFPMGDTSRIFGQGGRKKNLAQIDGNGQVNGGRKIEEV